MTNSLGDLFYSKELDPALGWVTYASGWTSATGTNALRYTRDGSHHQLTGQLTYTGATVASQARSTGTIVNFAPFATFANPLGNTSYDTVIIGAGIAMRWILSTAGALSLYRATNATWSLNQSDAFPINMHWLAPPGDPSYGFGPAVQVG